jgi:hypothetical protein
LKLFDAAVMWTANITVKPPQPKFEPPLLQAGNLKLTWSGTGRLQESVDLKAWADVPGNPASGIQVSVGSGAHKFYRLVQ